MNFEKLYSPFCLVVKGVDWTKGLKYLGVGKKTGYRDSDGKMIKYGDYVLQVRGEPMPCGLLIHPSRKKSTEQLRKIQDEMYKKFRVWEVSK